jgi:hypothetical protein
MTWEVLSHARKRNAEIEAIVGKLQLSEYVIKHVKLYF